MSGTFITLFVALAFLLASFTALMLRHQLAIEDLSTPDNVSWRGTILIILSMISGLTALVSGFMLVVDALALVPGQAWRAAGWTALAALFAWVVYQSVRSFAIHRRNAENPKPEPVAYTRPEYDYVPPKYVPPMVADGWYGQIREAFEVSDRTRLNLYLDTNYEFDHPNNEWRAVENIDLLDRTFYGMPVHSIDYSADSDGKVELIITRDNFEGRYARWPEKQTMEAAWKELQAAKEPVREVQEETLAPKEESEQKLPTSAEESEQKLQAWNDYIESNG